MGIASTCARSDDAAGGRALAVIVLLVLLPFLNTLRLAFTDSTL
ncbi:hypothetical protein ACTMTI_03785 [Nonomuraea sp. H19]